MLIFVIRKSTKSKALDSRNYEERHRTCRLILVMSIFYVIASAPAGFLEYVELFVTIQPFSILETLVGYGSIFISALFCLNASSHVIYKYSDQQLPGRTQTLSSRMNEERHLTCRMILVMTIFYVIASAPSGISEYVQLFVDIQSNSILELLVGYGSIFISALFCLNASSHGIINLTMSFKYRQTVKKWLGMEKQHQGSMVLVSPKLRARRDLTRSELETLRASRKFVYDENLKAKTTKYIMQDIHYKLNDKPRLFV
ncbi:hypothetical protein L5515_006418 [Caenorhabditis briggsae]|uniref:G-protein coupled receptors family 1 profile domain-containing protein n=1 Tax=Caenorhabditis briggsae TaxID=6238 RepID=A0AAE9JJZ3_CAEBR|nr:hypothetical protein L5515_006418 [Caenorhabditis briggsae]